jgi:hypothetical protein
LVLISITGEVFKNICDSIAQFKGMPIAGFSIKIDKNNISHDVLINHQPVKENLIYTLVMNSLLLKNKSFYSLLSKATIKSTNYNLRSSIIQYFEHLHQEGKSIHPTINNRITYDE